MYASLQCIICKIVSVSRYAPDAVSGLTIRAQESHCEFLVQLKNTFLPQKIIQKHGSQSSIRRFLILICRPHSLQMPWSDAAALRLRASAIPAPIALSEMHIGLFWSSWSVLSLRRRKICEITRNQHLHYVYLVASTQHSSIQRNSSKTKPAPLDSLDRVIRS